MTDPRDPRIPRGPMPELPEGIDQDYMRHLSATSMSSGETSAPGPMGTDPAEAAKDLLPAALRDRQDVTVLSPDADTRETGNVVREKLGLPSLDPAPRVDTEAERAARRAATPATGSWIHGTPTSATSSLINDTTAMVQGEIPPPPTLQDPDAHQPGAPLRNPLGVPLAPATAIGPYGERVNPDGTVKVDIPVSGPNVPQTVEQVVELAYPDADKLTLEKIADAWKQRQRQDELSDLFNSGRWKFTSPLPPPTAWTAPAPIELPELRDKLVRHLGRVEFAQGVSQALYDGKGTVNPFPEDPERGAALMIAEEQRRLRAAHLLSITAPMTELAKHAATKMNTLVVRPNDLPTVQVTNRDGHTHETVAWSGLMVFDTPMVTYVQENGAWPAEPVSIVAVSWGPTEFREEYDTPATQAPEFDGNGLPMARQDTLWVTYWHATDYDRQAWLHGQSHEFMLANGLPSRYGTRPMSRKQALTLAHQTHAPLDWNNESVIGFGIDMIDHVTNLCERKSKPRIGPNGEPVDDLLNDTHLGWLRIVLATWALTKNPRVSEVKNKTLRPRQEREAAKRNYNPAPVRVVHLHRSRHGDGGGERTGGHEIGVHYLRKGHWREQPYPSKGDGYTERIWIDEHVCGDTTKPLSQPKPRVLRVDRPPA